MLSHQPGCWRQAFLVATGLVLAAGALIGVGILAVGMVRNILA